MRYLKLHKKAYFITGVVVILLIVNLLLFRNSLFQRSSKPVFKIGYIGRYSQQGDNNALLFNKLHETTLNRYIKEWNESLREVEFQLVTFDSRSNPEVADSIYKNEIARDTHFVCVIDNGWGADLKACQSTIYENKIPIIAMNGDKNKLDFGSQALFTGNDDNIPRDLTAFLTKILKINKIVFITETDYPLHSVYLEEFSKNNVEIIKQFEVLGKTKFNLQDSATFFADIQAYIKQNPQLLNHWFVLNVHTQWGNRMIPFFNQQFTTIQLLGHAYIANIGLIKNFGLNNHNELILITNPTDATSQKITQDLQELRQQYPTYFARPNASFFLKRCQDAMSILSESLKNANNKPSRTTFQKAFKNLRNNTLIGDYDLYDFDSTGALIKELYFTEYAHNQLTSYPTQLNTQHQLIPNLFFGMEIIDMYDIDLNTNSFAADFFYWVKYDTNHKDLEKYILFQNMKQSESAKELVVEKADNETTYRLYKVSGKFYVNYDLSDYPFDAQELAIHTHIISPSDKIKIALDQQTFTLDSTIIEKFKIKAWEKKKYYFSVNNLISKSLRGDPSIQAGKAHKFKTLSFHLVISRNPLGPILEIILPLTLIGIVAIALLYIQDLSFANLGEVSVGTFLGIITFSIALSNASPASNSLTRADILFWITFSTVLISFLTVIILNSIYPETKAKTVQLPRLRLALTILYPLLTLLALYY